MRALVLLLLALAPLAARADPRSLGRHLNAALVADVFATGFAFMAPRTLDAVPIPTLALWALDGLTVLDPRLAPVLRGGTLLLTVPGQVVADRKAPDAADARGWGTAVAAMALGAWDVSEPVRRAGTQGIVTAMFDGVTLRLDPYSRYAAPAAADAERVGRAGAAGIGLRVAAVPGGFVLRDLAADGPGAAAGLREGQRLLAVDGTPTEGLDPDGVAALLAGPEGTEVLLTLAAGHGRTREVTLERALVPPRTVAAEWRGDVLVLRVSAFAIDTGAQLADALAEAIDGPRRPRGVVIDLRGNRGGLLRQAVAAAETLLAHGVIAVTAGRDPAALHSFVADGADRAGGLPVVVMVDAGSASSAEILAAALADQHRAVVVGSSTQGKGLVQTIAPLPDGGELFISWSRVFAPLGWPLQGLGVLPQVCTSFGAGGLERQLAGLAHGRQSMADVLARHRAARPPLNDPEVLELRSACPAAPANPLDLVAARRLIHDPGAYAAALLGPPPGRLAAGIDRTKLAP